MVNGLHLYNTFLVFQPLKPLLYYKPHSLIHTHIHIHQEDLIIHTLMAQSLGESWGSVSFPQNNLAPGLPPEPQLPLIL